MQGRKQGACDVCKLIDKSEELKDVGYCPMCNAWLCESCRTNPRRRAIAAGLRAFMRLKQGLEEGGAK